MSGYDASATELLRRAQIARRLMKQDPSIDWLTALLCVVWPNFSTEREA